MDTKCNKFWVPLKLINVYKTKNQILKATLYTGYKLILDPAFVEDSNQS